jgi:hypothetical protein
MKPKKSAKKQTSDTENGTVKSVDWKTLSTSGSSERQTQATTPPNLESTTMPTVETETQRRTPSAGRTTAISETRLSGSLTPYPNIDEAQSPSTNLIDNTTSLLSEQMHSLATFAKANENHFGTVQQVGAICNCAKNINALLRTKLDIFKAYKDSK